eukprot:c4885_g1_i1.p1 GENE.c4885_g1_i1~~c4885_g1_i1.p1  ORF type:complete len:198 (+),score=33.15 c4885_g1_i1:1-594(+)
MGEHSRMSTCRCGVDFGGRGDAEPMQLSCGHSFCRKCCTIDLSEQQSNSDAQLVCWVCQRITSTPIPSSSTATVVVGTTNIAFSNVLSAMKPAEEAQAVEKCVECSQTAATVYCEGCRNNLCEECSTRIHSMKASLTTLRSFENTTLTTLFTVGTLIQTGDTRVLEAYIASHRNGMAQSYRVTNWCSSSIRRNPHFL